MGLRGEGRKTGGRARESGIYFGSFQGIPVLSVNTEVVGLANDLFQTFLVCGFSSKSIWFGAWSREIGGINQRLFVVNNVYFPRGITPLIGIFLAVAIN